MTKKWDKHRDVIVRLYKEQNLPLHEVRKILEDKHQFKASCVLLILFPLTSVLPHSLETR